MPKKFRLSLGALAILANAYWIQRAWILHGNLGGLFIISAASLVIAAYFLWRQPADEIGSVPSQAREPAASWWRAIVGAAAAYAAVRAGLKDIWWPMLGWAALAAFSVAPLLPEDEAPLDRRFEVLLLIGIAAVAAVFRFWQLKEASYYFSPLVTDEALIWVKGRLILAGERPTFVVGPANLSDGALPFYFGALSIKLFGDTLEGFRSVSAMLGILNVLLIAAIAREALGPRLALIAAALTATATWPVAYSRANYLVNESLFLHLAGVAFLYWGYRRKNGLLFAIAGAFIGVSLNAYKSGQVLPILIAGYFILAYVIEPKRRALLWASAPPFAAGYAIAATPLLLWFAQNPKTNLSIYFNSLSPGQHTMGFVSNGFQGIPLTLVKRVYEHLGQLLSLFTTHGPFTPNYFPVGMPLLNKPMAAFCIIGLGGVFARPKNLKTAILPFWLLVGLLPAVMANPDELLADRRVVLALPVFMILAALGIHTVLTVASSGLRWARSHRGLIVLAGGLLAAMLLAPSHWDAYFNVVQKDPARLAAGRANIARYARVVADLNEQTPIKLLSYARWTEDSWTNPKVSPGTIEFSVVASKVTQVVAHGTPSWYQGHGLFETLSSDPGKSSDGRQLTWAVTLPAFDFYLLPVLQGLGNAKVIDVPIVQTAQGPLSGAVGMLMDDRLYAKILVFNNLDPAALKAAQARYDYHYTLSQMKDPDPASPTTTLYIQDPAYFKSVKDYWIRPGRWHPKKAVTLSLGDPWFWSNHEEIAPEIQVPYRSDGEFMLQIPTAGAYAFGAASTWPIRIWVDGKMAYEGAGYISSTTVDPRNGSLSEPIQLTKGDHRLRVEQAVLSAIGGNNLALRLIWQPPGGPKETLPLEVLYPAKTAKP